MTDKEDWIRARVVARVAELGLSGYAIAQRTGGKVNALTVRAYLSGEKSMTSGKLQHVLRVLGLTIEEEKRPGALR